MKPSPVVLLALLCVVGCGDPAQEGGPVEVRSRTIVWVDAMRETPANGSFPGAPDRTLETTIWWTDDIPPDSLACNESGCAIVLLAHGFGGNPYRFGAIAGILARAGYVVLAPRFPLTNESAPGGFTTALLDARSQPEDLVFVLDRALAAAPGELEIDRRMDAARVGLLGHSLGGVTSMGLSRMGCCASERIDAVVLVAPVVGLAPAIYGGSIDPAGPPTFVVSGALDPVVPEQDPSAWYGSIRPPRALLIPAQADHVNLIENVGEPSSVLLAVGETIVRFFDRYLGSGQGFRTSLKRREAEGDRIRFELD